MVETDVPLSYTEWMLVELRGEPVAVGDDQPQPSLALDLEESRASGSGGVNRIMGTFALAQSELRFGPLATTMMAGTGEEMALERAFLDALARVTSFQLDGGTLTLFAGDEAVARFTC